MCQVEVKKLYRIIDANFNRAKEGLRVCEDICRFIFDQKTNTRQYKKIRHQLTDFVNSLSLDKLIDARDIKRDVGKKTIDKELKRKNVSDIFSANSQRVKEAIRVLEEFSKLLNPTVSQKFKKLRYELYAMEKKTLIQC